MSLKNMEDTFMTIFAKKEATRFKVKVGVFLFLIKEDQVLLLKRYNTGIADGLYVVPMGGLKEGETVSQALIREAHEEAGIILTSENIKMCHLMHRHHYMPQGLSFGQIDVFFKAEDYQGVIQNMEPDKCDELKFYPLEALPKNTEGFICQALNCMQKEEFFSEFGWT